jgi:hypothetical protein
MILKKTVDFLMTTIDLPHFVGCSLGATGEHTLHFVSRNEQLLFWTPLMKYVDFPIEVIDSPTPLWNTAMVLLVRIPSILFRARNCPPMFFRAEH